MDCSSVGRPGSRWALLVETTEVYETPDWVRAVPFAGVIAREGLALALHWRALAASRGEGLADRRPVDPAFVVGVALSAGFVLADEVFVAYDVEATHLRLPVAQLVSRLAIHLLPDGQG